MQRDSVRCPMGWGIGIAGQKKPIAWGRRNFQRRQAVELGRSLAGCQFALVLCSPLRRAREPCRLASYEDEANATEDLLEWDDEIYVGKNDARNQVGAPRMVDLDGFRFRGRIARTS